MCRFLETICIENGVAINLERHEKRLNDTANHFWKGFKNISLSELLEDCPKHNGTFKARVVYDGSGVLEKTYAPYRMRDIKTLQVVEDNDIDYKFKSCDREALERLASQRGNCDEVLIIKNGFVTDTSYTNVAFFDGKDWFTPREPLLKGTKRAMLIAENKIIEREIHIENISEYKAVALFNAMIDLGRLIMPINSIRLNADLQKR